MQLAEEVKTLSSSVPLITAAVKPAIKPLGCLVLWVHQPVGTSEASRSSVSSISVARVRCNGTNGIAKGENKFHLCAVTILSGLIPCCSPPAAPKGERAVLLCLGLLGAFAWLLRTLARPRVLVTGKEGAPPSVFWPSAH